MATLSICLIIKNEKNCLFRCLSSIQAIADEIIVVDTGSTDDSVGIAYEFGAKVFYSVWTNDFSFARNFSLDQARGEWILVIDADEELDIKHLQLVRQKIEDPNAEAFFLTVTSSDKNKPEYLDTSIMQLRLFKNKKEYRFHGFIHEKILDSIFEHNPLAVVKTAEKIIIHHPSNTEGYGREYRFNRNLALINLVLNSEKDSILKHFFLGREYYRHCIYYKALKHLKLAYENYQRVNELCELQGMIISCLFKLGKLSEALTFVDNALLVRPGVANLCYFKGIICLTLGLYQQANQSLEAVLSNYPSPPYRDIVFYQAKYVCQYMLGGLAEYFLDMDSSLYYYLESLKNNPYQLTSLRRMITILDPRQNPDDTLDSLNRVFDLGDPGLQIELASIFYDEGAYQLSLDCLNRLERVGQISEKTRLLKGLCLLKLRNFPEAEELLGNITHCPEFLIKARQYLLFYHLIIKNSSLALEYFIEIKNAGADPTTIYILNLLTGSPADNAGINQNCAYELAKVFIELSVEICEKNQTAKVFNSLARLLGKRPSMLLAQTYFHYAKFEPAQEELLSLLKTGQDFPLTYYYLGKTYRALGNLEKALMYMNLAIEGGLNTPKITREKELLENDLMHKYQSKTLYYTTIINKKL